MGVWQGAFKCIMWRDRDRLWGDEYEGFGGLSERTHKVREGIAVSFAEMSANLKCTLLFFGWWKSRGCEKYYVSNKIHSSSLFVDEAIYLIALAIPWVGTFPQRTVVMNWLMVYFISSSSWFSAHFVCLVCLGCLHCLGSAHFVSLGSHLYYYIWGCYCVTILLRLDIMCLFLHQRHNKST